MTLSTNRELDELPEEASCVLVTRSHGGVVSLLQGLTVDSARQLADQFLYISPFGKRLDNGTIVNTWLIVDNVVYEQNYSRRYCEIRTSTGS
jgi:hypothetical protein